MSSSRILRVGSSWFVPFALSCASASPIVATKTTSACGMSGPDGGAPFSVAQAQASLTEAAMAASDCSADAKGAVIVQFSPAGCVLNLKLEVQGSDWTPEDTDCVAKAFFAARVEPYSGRPVAVRKAFVSTR